MVAVPAFSIPQPPCQPTIGDGPRLPPVARSKNLKARGQRGKEAKGQRDNPITQGPGHKRFPSASCGARCCRLAMSSFAPANAREIARQGAGVTRGQAGAAAQACQIQRTTCPPFCPPLHVHAWPFLTPQHRVPSHAFTANARLPVASKTLSCLAIRRQRGSDACSGQYSTNAFSFASRTPLARTAYHSPSSRSCVARQSWSSQSPIFASLETTERTKLGLHLNSPSHTGADIRSSPTRSRLTSRRRMMPVSPRSIRQMNRLL